VTETEQRLPLEIVPVTKAEAGEFNRRHRHNARAPLRSIFVVGVAVDGQLCGVALCGRPVARGLQDGRTLEVNRLCTDGTPNACSALYGASRRAALALGYRRVITYTLASESGASLRGAGYRRVADLPARPKWDTPSRRRVQVDLFGEDRRPTGPKVRWEWSQP
jgi:hypothetical protein